MSKQDPSISDFRPQAVNVNQHTERGLAMLQKSVQQDGWIGAITVAADGETFDGSARLETVADVMQTAEPIVIETDGTRPVVVVRTDIPDANDPRAKRLGVAANSIAAMDYNPDGAILAMLAQEDAQIKQYAELDDTAAGAILEAANAAGDGGAGSDAEPEIDKAAELQEKWQTVAGQLWAIGEHRLLCGDSTRREDVDRVNGGKSADCTVTDPPYGVGVDYKDFQDTPENVRRVIDGVMPMILGNLPAALTPGVPAMWDYPRPAWVGAWVHPASSSSGPWGFIGANPILFYGKDPYLANGKGRRDSSLVAAADRKGEDEHPVSKPLNVWEWLIERMTPEVGAVVFDPFGGSGTTMVACQNLGRKCRMIEISPSYCAVILERMAQAFPALDIHLIS